MNTPPTLEKVQTIFKDWLHLSDDYEFLEVILACRCDRRLAGDPVWLFAIANSGGTKTEIVRALDADDVYSLDSLTRHTLVSGKIAVDSSTGQVLPVKGILPQIDGKVLVIKDFTIILSKRVEERDEIFSQLRGLYDGYLEYGFGTTDKPVRIKAQIGLIAATTPAIDMYGKLYTMLGERFLKVRHNADARKTAMKASENLGKEGVMRSELQSIVERFVKHLNFRDYTIADDLREYVVSLAMATALLRTQVRIKFWRCEINEASTPNVEYPTRLTKQFLKLLKLLANIRGHDSITKEDIHTVQRVARDTCVPNRVKIIRRLMEQTQASLPNDLTVITTREVARDTGIPLTTCWRELKELEYLGLVEYDESYKEDRYGHQSHNPEGDGWTLVDPDTFNPLFGEPNIAISQTSYGRGNGVKDADGTKDTVLPVDVSETDSISDRTIVETSLDPYLERSSPTKAASGKTWEACRPTGFSGY